VLLTRPVAACRRADARFRAIPFYIGLRISINKQEVDIVTKGLELPINILVAIAVAVIILIGVVMLIGPQLGIFGGGVGLESAKSRYCGAYVRAGCVDNSSNGLTCASTGTTAMSPAIDANKDGKADNLFDFMGAYTGTISPDTCRRSCGCPGY